MIVPNRLRDQVSPTAGSVPTEPREWTRRRVVLLAALAEFVIVVISGLLIGSPTLGGVAVLGWIAANLALGFGIALGGGGRRTWAPALAGLLLGGLAAGTSGAVGMMVGLLPPPEDSSGPALIAVLAGLLVFLFGAPLLLFGEVIGSAIFDLRVERRHRAVGRGEIPLLAPTDGLENRSEGREPLDDVDLAKATSDGAATTVIRWYRIDANPDFLLGEDTARLATIGYALDAVQRYPSKTGLGWRLLGIGAILVDVVLFFSRLHLNARGAFDDAALGRTVATFRLKSMTHGPIAGEERSSS